MRHSEFRTGEYFYIPGDNETPYSRWLVTDVGTRTVAAIRVDKVASHRTERVRSTPLHYPVTLTEAEARAQGLLSGPPYAVAEVIFDEDDFEVCCREIEGLR